MNSINSRSPIFKTITLTLAIIFASTSVSWSEPVSCALRPRAAEERATYEPGKRPAKIGFLGVEAIRDFLLKRKCSRLAQKAGLEKESEEFDLAVELGMRIGGAYAQYLFKNSIPAVFKAAKTRADRISFLQSLEGLITTMQKRGLNLFGVLRYGIPAAASSAKTDGDVPRFLN